MVLMSAKSPAEIVTEAMKILGPRAEERGIDALSPAERAVVLTVWAAGIIGNGGFRYFYEGAYFRKGKNHIPALAESYELLGLSDAARATRKSVEFYPIGLPDLGPEQTNQYMDGKSEKELDAFFGPLDRAIWAVDRDQILDTALAAVLARGSR